MAGFPQIQEFFVEGRNRKTSHVLLHISEPSTAAELPKGSLFALIEITGGTTEQIEELQQCIDEIESRYYSESSDNPEVLFEQILEQMNRKSHHMLSGGAVDAVVGVMIGGTILLSYHGAPIAYVFYQQKQEYKPLSIINDAEESSVQLFSSVLSGSIHMHDYFFVGTPSVGRYFSEDRIQKIITARDVGSGSTHLERVLANLKSDISFGGIVSKLISHQDLPKTGKIPPHLKQGSGDSIHGLVEAQDNTTETLNPSLLQSGKSLFSFHPQQPAESRKKQPPTPLDTSYDDANTTPFIISFLRGTGTVLLTLSSILLTVLERIMLFFKDATIMTWFLITNHKNRRTEIINTITRAYEDKKRSFLHLSLLSKILLLGTILAITIFVGSIIVYQTNKQQVAQKQAYTLALSEIQSTYQKAQAQFTYNDRSGALSLLTAAQTKASELPTNTDEQKQTRQSLLNSIAILLDQVRNITIVTPTVLATIPSTTEKPATPTRLARIQNTLIAFGANDNTHYAIPTVGGTVESRDHSSLPPLLRASTPKENDTIIFLGDTQSAGALDPTNQTISSKTIVYPTAGATPNDIALYNRRAYILDAQNNQIYKHNPTASGYDKGALWVQTQLEGSTLTDGVSIAIDGDVFVLTSGGAIKKFVAGKEESFTITGLDPALTNPAELFTYTDITSIYILEPKNKRVVVLDKTGKLIKQYTASEWNNPTSMSVDEKNKTVYVLDSNVVYSFGL
jgi:hypothetical protein